MRSVAARTPRWLPGSSPPGPRRPPGCPRTRRCIVSRGTGGGRNLWSCGEPGEPLRRPLPSSLLSRMRTSGCTAPCRRVSNPFPVSPSFRRVVYACFQERQPIVEHEALEVGVELARRDGGAGEGGEGLPALLALAWLAQRNLDALVVDLDDVVRRRHRAAHTHRRYGARVHDPHPRDAPDVGDVPVAREDHIHPQLTQDCHDVASVAQVVDVASRAGDGQDVVVDHEYPWPAVPAAELGVEPTVVLAPDLSLVEIRLRRVERDDLGLSLGDGDLGRPLPYAEELLEVPVADVLGIMVAHSVHDVRTLQMVEIASRLLELPAVSLHRQVTHDGHEIRLQSVALLDGSLEKILPKQTRTHMNIRHLYYPHPSLPSESRPTQALHRLEESLRPSKLLPDGAWCRRAGGALVLHAPARRKQPFRHL